MTEIAAVALVALASVLGYRFWAASAGFTSRTRTLSRLAVVAVGLGLAALAFEWPRSPEPGVTISGWPFAVLGTYKMPDGAADLYHIGVMDSFVAGAVANAALGLSLAFLVGWLIVSRVVPGAR